MVTVMVMVCLPVWWEEMAGDESGEMVSAAVLQCCYSSPEKKFETFGLNLSVSETFGLNSSA
jgi:hypothetical protein